MTERFPKALPQPSTPSRVRRGPSTPSVDFIPSARERSKQWARDRVRRARTFEQERLERTTQERLVQQTKQQEATKERTTQRRRAREDERRRDADRAIRQQIDAKRRADQGRRSLNARRVRRLSSAPLKRRFQERGPRPLPLDVQADRHHFDHLLPWALHPGEEWGVKSHRWSGRWLHVPVSQPKNELRGAHFRECHHNLPNNTALLLLGVNRIDERSSGPSESKGPFWFQAGRSGFSCHSNQPRVNSTITAGRRAWHALGEAI